MCWVCNGTACVLHVWLWLHESSEFQLLRLTNVTYWCIGISVHTVNLQCSHSILTELDLLETRGRGDCLLPERQNAWQEDFTTRRKRKIPCPGDSNSTSDKLNLGSIASYKDWDSKHFSGWNRHLERMLIMNSESWHFFMLRLFHNLHDSLFMELVAAWIVHHSPEIITISSQCVE